MAKLAAMFPTASAEHSDMDTHRTIDALEQPALIIDAAHHVLIDANEPGIQLWGLFDRSELPLALPADMPALTAIACCADSTASSSNLQSSIDLLFWTKLGAQKLRCRMQRTASTKDVLVIIETGYQPADQRSPNHSSLNSSSEDETDAAPQTTATTPFDTRVMGHELRTPLSAIVALAEMIERQQFGPIGDHRYVAYAKDIGDSARLTLSIVAAALDKPNSSAREAGGSFAEIDPAEVIDRCARTMRPALAAAGISFQCSLPDRLPRLIANAPALSQILLNFLTNSIKFTPQGGTVELTAKVMVDGALEISVSDNGVGMTPHDARLLLPEPGASPHPEPGAAGNLPENTTQANEIGRPSITYQRGIGFSLVRQLATTMDAKIHISSKRGTGTRVSVSFPASKLIPN